MYFKILNTVYYDESSKPSIKICKEATIEIKLFETNRVLKTNIMYPKNVVENAIKKILPKMKSGSLFGEFNDISIFNEERKNIILFEHISHIFTGDIRWDGDDLWAIIKTAKEDQGGRGGVLSIFVSTLKPHEIIATQRATATISYQQKENEKDNIKPYIRVETLDIITFDLNLNI